MKAELIANIVTSIRRHITARGWNVPVVVNEGVKQVLVGVYREGCSGLTYNLYTFSSLLELDDITAINRMKNDLSIMHSRLSVAAASERQKAEIRGMLGVGK